MNNSLCHIPINMKNCKQIAKLDLGFIELEIKAEVLARLIQTNQLTIEDIKCSNKQTKELVQATLLNCLVCKSANIISQQKI